MTEQEQSLRNHAAWAELLTTAMRCEAAELPLLWGRVCELQTQAKNLREDLSEIICERIADLPGGHLDHGSVRYYAGKLFRYHPNPGSKSIILADLLEHAGGDLASACEALTANPFKAKAREVSPSNFTGVESNGVSLRIRPFFIDKKKKGQEDDGNTRNTTS